MRLILCMQRIIEIWQTKFPAIRKYRNRIKNPHPRVPNLPRPPAQPRNRGLITNDEYDIYERTGIYTKQFFEVYSKVAPRYHESRNSHNHQTNSLHPHIRLLLTLHYLRCKPKYKDMKREYGVSIAYISRELHFAIPLLSASLHEIHWPATFTKHPFCSVAGIVDCTSHYRDRVHPRQTDYYRGDKHASFITAQVVVGFDGTLYNITFGQGHNNDQGMFNLSGLRDKVLRENLYLLADGGYSHPHLITPDDKNMPFQWNQTQVGLRSVGEVSIGYPHGWDFAGTKVKQGPHLQSHGLNAIYQLAAMMMKEFPIRQPELIVARYREWI